MTCARQGETPSVPADVTKRGRRMASGRPYTREHNVWLRSVESDEERAITDRRRIHKTTMASHCSRH